ncbi:hypothetical protein R3P38DRAFT_3170505 [Favolaschia claudopus]|uniref:Uncharacterized protein n=1 Tax=Favolaschia claudopus TaxID=2862362 RepID=A0AAW0DX77_9AGAR
MPPRSRPEGYEMRASFLSPTRTLNQIQPPCGCALAVYASRLLSRTIPFLLRLIASASIRLLVFIITSLLLDESFLLLSGSRYETLGGIGFEDNGGGNYLERHVPEIRQCGRETDARPPSLKIGHRL